MTAIQLLDSKVVKRADGCWSVGARCTGTYVIINVGGKSEYAHRVMYEAKVGKIGKGKDLAHTECRRRWCVNPAHMQPVTPAQKIRNMAMVRAHGGEVVTDIGRWMDRNGITSNDVAKAAKASLGAARNWRQVGYPSEKFEGRLRAKWADFPKRGDA